LNYIAKQIVLYLNFTFRRLFLTCITC